MRPITIKKLSGNINEFRNQKIRCTSIKKDKVCVFIGKRETGKSFLVRIYYTTIKIYQ